jgi:hypothetical protein
MGQKSSHDTQQQQQEEEKSNCTESSFFETKDHVKIHQQWWLPDNIDRLQAIVMVLHSYGGHTRMVEGIAPLLTFQNIGGMLFY